MPRWPWSRRPAKETDEDPPVTPSGILAAVQAVQADVRRLGGATVRAESRLDAFGAQMTAGLEQLTRQAARLAEVQDVAATERARVLSRFFDLGDALARAQAALDHEASVRGPSVPEEAAAVLRQQQAVCAEVLGRLRAQFVRTLEDFGCESVAVPGAPFDPRQHRAIARVERPELAGRVTQVARDGWKLDGRLLRVADVVVAVGTATADSASAGGQPANGSE